MLKKIGFGLLIFLLFSFALEPFPENFERPWNYEYHWPGNSSVVNYAYVPLLTSANGTWGVFILQQSLARLSLNAVNLALEIPKIAAAKDNYNIAKNIYLQIDALVDEKGEQRFLLLINATTFCKEYGFTECPCITVPPHLICTKPLPPEITYALACMSQSEKYSDAWKKTMNNALDVLEERAHLLNEKLWNLKQKYIEINETGICAQDIGGYKICEEVSFFLNAVETQSIAPGYANLTQIKEILINNSLKIYDDVPFVEFAWAVNLIGGDRSGEIERIDSFENGLDAYLNAKETNYKKLVKETTDAINEAEELKTNVMKNDCWRIRVSSSFEGIIGDNTGVVSENTKKGTENLKKAYAHKNNALNSYNFVEKDYLANALRNISRAKELALQSKNEFQTALDGAENVVLDYENNAVNWISKVDGKFKNVVWPEKALIFYNQAVENLNEGRKTTVLGLKFEKYINTIMYAKQAYAISLESEQKRIRYATSCEKAEEFLKRAEIDGIAVTSERTRFSVLMQGENLTNTNALIFSCEEIIENIVRTAKYKYSGLPVLRDKTYALLELCGNDCFDLIKEMQNIVRIENKIISNGVIIYPDAIGSLSILEKGYLDNIVNAEISIKKQIPYYLLVRKNLFAENAMLDTKTKARIEIEVTNTVDYAGENVWVNVDSPFSFDIDDIVYGNENLKGAVYLDGKLKLYIKKINASGKAQFIFEKNRTLLKTEKITVNAFGQEDFSAQVEEKRDVFCEANVRGFYVDEKWKMFFVNGVPVNIMNGFVPMELAQGQYLFKVNYYLDNVYSCFIYSNTSTIVGERVYYKYITELRPELDMVYVQKTITIPKNTNLKDKNVITISGEKLERTETPDGFLIKIFGLKKGTPVRFEISYYVDNSSEYIRNEIEKLKSVNRSENVEKIINNAEAAHLKNDSTTAVQKIQEAYDLIKKENIEDTKLRAVYSKTYGEVETELGKIEELLAGEKENYYFIEQVSARRDYLKDVVDSLEGKELAEQISVLKGYDAKWISVNLRAFKKNASTEINLLYKTYLELTNELGDENSINFAELKAFYNKFDASASLEDGYALANKLASVKEKIVVLQEQFKEKQTIIAKNASVLKEEITTLFEQYENEYNTAKGGKFESVFKIKIKDVQTTLKQITDGLKKQDMEIISKSYEKLVGLRGNLSETLDFLKNSATRNANQSKEMINTLSGRFSEKDAKTINSLVSRMNEHLGAEKWVNALETNEEILKIASSLKVQPDYNIIMWLSVIFIIGVVVVYYIKGKKEGGIKKILKKLEKSV